MLSHSASVDWGCPRHQGGISEKACLDARETTATFVDKWLPDLRFGIDSLPEVEVDRMDQSLYRAEIVLETGRRRSWSGAFRNTCSNTWPHTRGIGWRCTRASYVSGVTTTRLGS